MCEGPLTETHSIQAGAADLYTIQQGRVGDRFRRACMSRGSRRTCFQLASCTLAPGRSFDSSASAAHLVGGAGSAAAQLGAEMDLPTSGEIRDGRRVYVLRMQERAHAGPAAKTSAEPFAEYTARAGEFHAGRRLFRPGQEGQHPGETMKPRGGRARSAVAGLRRPRSSTLTVRAASFVRHWRVVYEFLTGGRRDRRACTRGGGCRGGVMLWTQRAPRATKWVFPRRGRVFRFGGGIDAVLGSCAHRQTGRDHGLCGTGVDRNGQNSVVDATGPSCSLLHSSHPHVHLAARPVGRDEEDDSARGTERRPPAGRLKLRGFSGNAETPTRSSTRAHPTLGSWTGECERREAEDFRRFFGRDYARTKAGRGGGSHEMGRASADAGAVAFSNGRENNGRVGRPDAAARSTGTARFTVAG